MHHFAKETALTGAAEGHWNGHVSPDWGIGDNPNGGYLVAIAIQALKQISPQHPDPLSITTHFLRPGLPDQDCEVRVESIRTGRTVSNSRATLYQDGKARIEVSAVMGDLGPASSVEPVLALSAPEIPPPERCIERSGKEQGVELPLLNRLNILLHPDEAHAGAAGKAQVSGWIGFKDGMDPDSTSAIVFADAFPPSVFGLLGVVGWVPTLELTVHVRRRPAPGWILGQFATSDLTDGRMVENGCLWDSAGHLIAQSRQMALVLKAV